MKEQALRHRAKQVTASLMLLLFVGYYADVNCFSHAHIINGVTIVHSHLHNAHHHDTNAGGHTSAEITLIANLSSQLLTTGETPVAEPATYTILLQTVGTEQACPTQEIDLTCRSMRAPPAEIG